MVSDTFYWLAANIELWRPFALAALAIIILALLWYAMAAWENME